LKSLKGIGNLEELSVDGRIILKLISRKWVWAGLIWLRIGTGSGFL
jgi:hypothetical protein